jgi:hypothetical protein
MAIDIFAPIMPNCGLGGLVLRANVRDLQQFLLLDSDGLPDPRWFRLSRPFEARYGLGCVEAIVDVRNGKIARLIARRGYSGLLFGAIGVGMRMGDLPSWGTRWWFDDAEALVFRRDEPGVSLHPSVEDALPEEVESLTVESISVFAPEAWESVGGAEGMW